MRTFFSYYTTVGAILCRDHDCILFLLHSWEPEQTTKRSQTESCRNCLSLFGWAAQSCWNKNVIKTSLAPHFRMRLLIKPTLQVSFTKIFCRATRLQEVVKLLQKLNCAHHLYPIKWSLRKLKANALSSRTVISVGCISQATNQIVKSPSMCDMDCD